MLPERNLPTSNKRAETVLTSYSYNHIDVIRSRDTILALFTQIIQCH
ncbi:hypothetical protein VCRA212O16_430033 [Vibrio crassostreae]|nr:hypothetical protein VCRA212O16_430033 [Vibrio crassostreae]